MNAIVNETRAPGITAAHPTHKLKWLLKRELWEHRGGFIWAPLIAGIALGIAAGFVAERALSGRASR